MRIPQARASAHTAWIDARRACAGQGSRCAGGADPRCGRMTDAPGAGLAAAGCRMPAPATGRPSCRSASLRIATSSRTAGPRSRRGLRTLRDQVTALNMMRTHRRPMPWHLPSACSEAAARKPISTMAAISLSPSSPPSGTAGRSPGRHRPAILPAARAPRAAVRDPALEQSR